MLTILPAYITYDTLTSICKHMCSMFICSSWSENNFAICLPLEIPARGCPFQMKAYEICRIHTNNTILTVQRNYVRKEIPSWGSQAGTIAYMGFEHNITNYDFNTTLELHKNTP